MHTNSLTITYLSKVSFASLNAGDKEDDNINPIKKITLKPLLILQLIQTNVLLGNVKLK